MYTHVIWSVARATLSVMDIVVGGYMRYELNIAAVAAFQAVSQSASILFIRLYIVYMQIINGCDNIRCRVRQHNTYAQSLGRE